jgi:hypothetical protein
MPAVAGVLFTLLAFLAMLAFCWRQLRIGGRWGQRPAAQRAVPLGGVLFIGGLLIGVASLRLHNSALAGLALLAVATGEFVILLGPRLFRRLDERRSARIRRGLGLG